MRVSKIEWFDIICPKCGAKITLYPEEYKKYLEETEGYGNEIIVMDKMPGENQELDIARYQLPCPNCMRPIPLNLSEIESDRWGFNLPIGVEPFYGITEDISMDSYLSKIYEEDENLIEEDYEYEEKDTDDDDFQPFTDSREVDKD